MNFLRNNPEKLDEFDEIRDAVRDQGGNPMNIGTQEEALFGHSILNRWEDDPPKSRSKPSVFAAEAEMVATSLEEEYGVEVEEMPSIRDAPSWYDGPKL